MEIQASGINAAELEDVVEAAFLVIGQVHRLMSFHDPRERVSRMAATRVTNGCDSSMDMARPEIGAGNFSKNRRHLPRHNGRQTGEIELSSEGTAGVLAAEWRDITLEATGHV